MCVKYWRVHLSRPKMFCTAAMDFQERSVAALLLFVLSLFVVLNAQEYGFGVPVGTYSRLGPNGEKESISSIGGAKVGVYRRVFPPQPIFLQPLPSPRKKPSYPAKNPSYPVKKPSGGVQGRIASGLLSGILGGAGGLLGGLLGGR